MLPRFRKDLSLQVDREHCMFVVELGLAPIDVAFRERDDFGRSRFLVLLARFAGKSVRSAFATVDLNRMLVIL